MKSIIWNLLAAMLLVAASLQARAQALIYDQQTTNAPSVSGDYFNIQPDSPLLQSFVPALSTIGFVQFEFSDGFPNNGTNGATVYVNLWTGSPNTNSATFLGSTTPVYMPNGFGTSIAGVTNFYFSTPITLTSGQTYYLQPVVLSGDNPYDIKVNNDFFNENYYANGSLFEKGTDVGIDSWFREGVVSVPEPATLALVALSSFLIFAFKRCSKVPVLFLAGVLFTAIIPPAHSAPDSVVQATADEAGLTPVSTTELPSTGTFWVMTVGPDGRLGGPPYPVLPPKLSALPTYLVKGNIFIVDDTGGQILPPSIGKVSSAQAAAAAQAQAESMASLIDLILNPNNGRNGGIHAMDAPAPPGGGDGGTNGGYQPGSNLRTYGSNDLWLSITSATNGISQIVIHPPWNVNVSTDSWNVFYTTNVAAPFSNWWWILTTDLGQTNLVVANAIAA